jgi:hypothetical protein
MQRLGIAFSGIDVCERLTVGVKDKLSLPLRQLRTIEDQLDHGPWPFNYWAASARIRYRVARSTPNVRATSTTASPACRRSIASRR